MIGSIFLEALLEHYIALQRRCLYHRIQRTLVP